MVGKAKEKDHISRSQFSETCMILFEEDFCLFITRLSSTQLLKYMISKSSIGFGFFWIWPLIVYPPCNPLAAFFTKVERGWFIAQSYRQRRIYAHLKHTGMIESVFLSEKGMLVNNSSKVISRRPSPLHR